MSFVGTVSPDHRQRIALLEAVAERYDLKLFGSPPQALPAASPLHRCFQGEVWGADMYQALRRSKITLNSHIDMAGREAGNMRLFEATGVGAFLLTDFKDNLHTLFAPDREVAVWRSVDDCLAAIDRAIGDDDGRAAIARAGQARTMAQHTYRHRAAEILGFVDGSASAPMKLPRIVRQIGKRVVQGDADPAPAYSVIDRLSRAQRQPTRRGAQWPHRADGLRHAPCSARSAPTRRLIAAMKHGEPRLDFTVAAEAVAATGIVKPRLIEIGCGSGYYSEVFAELLPGGVDYTGIDYSDAMIARARAHYPSDRIRGRRRDPAALPG